MVWAGAIKAAIQHGLFFAAAKVGHRHHSRSQERIYGPLDTLSWSTPQKRAEPSRWSIRYAAQPRAQRPALMTQNTALRTATNVGPFGP